MGTGGAPGGAALMTYEIEINGRSRRLELSPSDGGWRVALDGQTLAADAARVDGRTLSLILEGRSYSFAWERLETSREGTQLWLGSPNLGAETAAWVRDPRRQSGGAGFEQSGRVRLKAPMAGKVVRVLAAVGDELAHGQGVVILEAMKMQNEVRSPKAGVLVGLPVKAGEAVATGQVLAEVE